MAEALAPREVTLLRELGLSRARGDLPTSFFLASMLEISVDELESLIEKLFDLGLVEWEVVVAGGQGGGRHLVFGGKPRWCPRITHRGLGFLRRSSLVPESGKERLI